MKGTVNETKMVGQGQNEKGPWTRWSVTVDGTAYNYFGDPSVKPGDPVEYETITKGKYTNLKSISKIDLPKPHPMEPVTGYRGKSSDELATINRAVALKAAVEFGGYLVQMNAKADGLMTAHDLLVQIESMCIRWYNYLQSGKTAPIPGSKSRSSDPIDDDGPPIDAYIQDDK
jgi:hypothetical protein